MNEVDETNPLGTLIVHVKSYEFILNSCGAEVVNQLTDAQTLTLARLIKILISFIRHELIFIFILLSSVLMQREIHQGEVKATKLPTDRGVMRHWCCAPTIHFVLCSWCYFLLYLLLLLPAVHN